MMQKEKCVFLMLLMLILTGCGRIAEKEDLSEEITVTTEAETEEMEQFPGKMHRQVSEGLEIDAAIIMPEDFDGSLRRYKSGFKEYDKETLINTLGIDLSEMESPEQDIFFNDQMNLTLGEYLTFSTNKGMEYRGLCMDEFYSDAERLSFADGEEAKEQICDLLENLFQMTSLEVDRSYIFDSQSEEKYKSWFGEEEGVQMNLKTGEKEETDILQGAEGGYYFEVIQTIDQVPVYPYDQDIDGAFVTGFMVQCILTEKGIEYLTASLPYETAGEVRNVEVLDVEGVTEALCKKLENVIVTEKLKVTEMKLIYVPTQQSELKPVWQITAVQGEDETRIYFDAETGRELLL